MSTSAMYPAVTEVGHYETWNLGRTYRKIIEELADAILPEEGNNERVKQHVVRFIDNYIPYLPVLFRKTFPLGLLLLQWGTVLTVTVFRPFTLAGTVVRRRYLHRWETSRFPLFRGLIQGVRGLILAAYYEIPAVGAQVGYRPIEHLADCKQRRDELLAKHGDVDDHTASMIFEEIGNPPVVCNDCR